MVHPTGPLAMVWTKSDARHHCVMLCTNWLSQYWLSSCWPLQHDTAICVVYTPSLSEGKRVLFFELFKLSLTRILQKKRCFEVARISEMQQVYRQCFPSNFRLPLSL